MGFHSTSFSERFWKTITPNIEKKKKEIRLLPFLQLFFPPLWKKPLTKTLRDAHRSFPLIPSYPAFSALSLPVTHHWECWSCRCCMSLFSQNDMFYWPLRQRGKWKCFQDDSWRLSRWILCDGAVHPTGWPEMWWSSSAGKKVCDQNLQNQPHSRQPVPCLVVMIKYVNCQLHSHTRWRGEQKWTRGGRRWELDTCLINTHICDVAPVCVSIRFFDQRSNSDYF